MLSRGILVLKLWAKMLLASQIVGFFKVPYIRKCCGIKMIVWHVDQQQNLLQVDIMSFDGLG